VTLESKAKSNQKPGKKEIENRGPEEKWGGGRKQETKTPCKNTTKKKGGRSDLEASLKALAMQRPVEKPKARGGRCYKEKVLGVLPEKKVTGCCRGSRGSRGPASGGKKGQERGGPGKLCAILAFWAVRLSGRKRIAITIRGNENEWVTGEREHKERIKRGTRQRLGAKKSSGTQV